MTALVRGDWPRELSTYADLDEWLSEIGTPPGLYFELWRRTLEALTHMGTSFDPHAVFRFALLDKEEGRRAAAYGLFARVLGSPIPIRRVFIVRPLFAGDGSASLGVALAQLGVLAICPPPHGMALDGLLGTIGQRFIQDRRDHANEVARRIRVVWAIEWRRQPS